LEATNGKLQLVIKSEKMVSIVEFDVPIMTRYGKVGVTEKWARVYEYVFDEGQMRALSEARELASKSRLSLAARIGTGSRQSSKTTPMGTQAKRGTVISQAARP